MCTLTQNQSISKAGLVSPHQQSSQKKLSTIRILTVTLLSPITESWGQGDCKTEGPGPFHIPAPRPLHCTLSCPQPPPARQCLDWWQLALEPLRPQARSWALSWLISFYERSSTCPAATLTSPASLARTKGNPHHAWPQGRPCQDSLDKHLVSPRCGEE